MNSMAYVVFMALCVTVAFADEPRSKKEVGYNTPYVQNTDLNKYLASGGYDHAYYNNPAQSAANYPNNQNNNNYYQPQPFLQPYNYQQPQPYQPYQNGHQQGYQQGYQQYNGYPYNANQQHYGQHYNAQPYQNNYYQQQYPNTFGYPQNAYGHYPQSQYEPFPVRQAPIYPSPGAQPVSQPAPHPFYHQQGVYYPPQLYPSTTEANKPVTVYPKKN